ncbi:MAG: hypothetical protein VKJ24_21455 [Synechococcales bacterium]|nr:hypothetical protein [Synechococcales bacterium]
MELVRGDRAIAGGVGRGIRALTKSEEAVALVCYEVREAWQRSATKSEEAVALVCYEVGEACGTALLRSQRRLWQRSALVGSIA